MVLISADKDRTFIEHILVPFVTENNNDVTKSFYDTQ